MGLWLEVSTPVEAHLTELQGGVKTHGRDEWGLWTVYSATDHRKTFIMHIGGEDTQDPGPDYPWAPDSARHLACQME